MGFPIKGVKISSNTDLVREKGVGRNVLAHLQTGNKPASELIVIGAHALTTSDVDRPVREPRVNAEKKSIMVQMTMLGHGSTVRNCRISR